MIPQFPEFNPLILSHKTELQNITAQFEPYSDFDFTSLLCWNFDGSTSISQINGNLVIKIPDYITGDPVISLMGRTSVDKSLDTLLLTFPQLELVPGEVVSCITQKERFLIEEDFDQFDYIYSLKDHAQLTGGRFKGKRNKLGRFKTDYSDQINLSTLDLRNEQHVASLRMVFDKWDEMQTTNSKDTEQEKLAIERLIEFSSSLNIVGYLLYVGDSPIGFSIVEALGKDNSIYHFQKTLKQYEFSDIFLTQATSALLTGLGCKYINWEQDLGIEGLRNAKENYHPIKMLKKYTIKKN